MNGGQLRYWRKAAVILQIRLGEKLDFEDTGLSRGNITSRGRLYKILRVIEILKQLRSLQVDLRHAGES